ncbi:flagellar biosynthesis protein FlhF [Bacillus carboniphilus]|uniref:Flagellar biosynthesis protein FlhF n=1 Tax=Bacillus carboniphilus TaxID=86663 RepID=A0ABP3G2N0_9BACI
MKFKKYVAPNMPEAMKKVRAELGQNAVIINSKTIYNGGIFGLFKRKNIEVIAAVDPEAASGSKTTGAQKRKLSVTPESTIIKEEKPSYEKNGQDMTLLLKEIQKLQADLQRNTAKTDTTMVPNDLKPIMNRLESQGVASHLLFKWGEALTTAYFDANKPEEKEKIIELFDQVVLSEKQDRLESTDLLEKKFVALVGPTGVGKTTTLAKLAAQTILKKKKKVAFITTDTYRIAAIEQLKTYASIVGAPVEVCYNIEDFKRAKERFHQYDTIFIDTAGRNFRNPQYVEDLKDVIDFKEDVQTFLTLSLTAKESDMRQIIDQFSLLHIDRFIFTKMDETSSYGTILNLVWDTDIGVGYLTNGQNVPDDLTEASKNSILSYLVGDGDQNGPSSNS